MKQSEARILIYLTQVSTNLRNPASVCRKLDVDYAYTLRIMRNMKMKGWLSSVYKNNRKYYEITKEAPISLAEKALL